MLTIKKILIEKILIEKIYVYDFQLIFQTLSKYKKNTRWFMICLIWFILPFKNWCTSYLSLPWKSLENYFNILAVSIALIFNTFTSILLVIGFLKLMSFIYFSTPD